ncbi:hypothetical protein LBMAG42_39380 [Deltaproteobacteria bacterium]|nr:hypothetical protein LBMAG42_39380 [Deltaproteobacteria bacterium]
MSSVLLVAAAFAGGAGEPQELLPDWCAEDAELRLSAADAGWCEHVPPACPGLKRACAELNARAERPSGGCNEATDRKPEEPPVKVERPAAIPAAAELPAAVGQGLGWGLLGLALVMVILGLLRRRGEDAGDDAVATAIAESGQLPPQIGAAPEGGDWLLAARRAAEAGRIAEALLLARGAVVAALEARGALAPDPGRTDRELVRGFGSEPGTQAGLRVLVTAIERVRYAGGRVDRETVDRALTAAARIVAGSAVVLIALCSSIARAEPSDRELLAPLLTSHGLVVTSGTTLQPTGGALVWEPDAWTTQEEMDQAIEAARAGDTVFVFGRAAAAMLEGVGVRDGGAAHVPLRGEPGMSRRDLWPELHLPKGARQLEGEGSALLRDAAGEPVAVELLFDDVGVFVVVADDHLLDDASLLHNENVDTLLGILALPEGSSVVIVSPAISAPTAQDQVIQAGFGVAVVQILLLWGLWSWSRGRRFAGRLGLVEATPRDFTAHLHAVARFYRVSRSSHVGFAAVSQRALAQLRRITATDDAALATAIAARLGEDAHFLQNLLDRAHAAAADPNGPSTDDEPWLTETLWNLVLRLQSHTTSPNSQRSSER